MSDTGQNEQPPIQENSQQQNLPQQTQPGLSQSDAHAASLSPQAEPALTGQDKYFLSQEEGQALIQSFRAGSDTALDTFFERANGPLTRYFRYLGVEDANVDDVVQDTLEAIIKILRSEDQSKLPQNLGSFTYGVAHNKARMYFRSGASRKAHEGSLDKLIEYLAHDESTGTDGGPVEGFLKDAAENRENQDPAQIVIEGEKLSVLRQAIGKLSQGQRAVIEYDLQGLKTDDIAQLMGKEEGTVRALRFRAMASLRRLLTETDFNED